MTEKMKNKSSYCSYLIERLNNKSIFCRLRHLNPVLNKYEIDMYCKSKSINTCPYLQHVSESKKNKIKKTVR